MNNSIWNIENEMIAFCLSKTKATKEEIENLAEKSKIPSVALHMRKANHDYLLFNSGLPNCSEQTRELNRCFRTITDEQITRFFDFLKKK